MVAVCLSVEGSGVSFASGNCCAAAAAEQRATSSDSRTALRACGKIALRACGGMALRVVMWFLDFGADVFGKPRRRAERRAALAGWFYIPSRRLRHQISSESFAGR